MIHGFHAPLPQETETMGFQLAVLENAIENNRKKIRSRAQMGLWPARATSHPILRFQQTVGNRRVRSIINSNVLQPKIRTDRTGIKRERDIESRFRSEFNHLPQSLRSTWKTSNGIIQKDLALEQPAEVPEQPELTNARVERAIRYNRASYSEESTRLIQDLVGAEQTGRFDETTVRLIYQFQRDFGLRADGKAGPNTYDLLIRELRAEGGEPDNCLTMFQIVGPEPLRFFRNSPTSGTIGSRFYIKIRFDPRCNCQDWEYRQYIAGSVDLHDVAGPTFNLNHLFAVPGGGLPTTLREDGDTGVPGGVAGRRYGHRAHAPNPSDGRDRYLPDRRTGCIYEGHDFPELGPIPATPGDTGDRYEWTMRFRGVIRRRGHGVVEEKYWVIRGTIVIP